MPHHAFQFATEKAIQRALPSALLLVTLLGTPLSGQTHNAFGHELYTEVHESEIALSAAPAAVARDAGIWVLRSEGFAQVRESRNGFNCMVQRANDVSIIAPTCFDAEASRTIMQAQLLQGKLWSQGQPASDIVSAVATAYRTGELQPPRRGAVGYMLSSAQSLGENVGKWHPHMMIYAPYVTEEDIGAHLRDPKNPVYMLNPGRPDARIVVVVSEFVDPGESKNTGPTNRNP